MSSQASGQGEDQYEDLSAAERVLVNVENTLSLGSPRIPAVDWDQRLKDFTEASVEKTKRMGDGALQAVGLTKERAEGEGERGGRAGEEELNPVHTEVNKLASWTVDLMTEGIDSSTRVLEQTQKAVPETLDSSMVSLAEVGEEAARLAHETTKAGNELLMKAGETLVTGATEVIERHLGKQEKVSVNSLAQVENLFFGGEPSQIYANAEGTAA